jgi:hypothetical protein
MATFDFMRQKTQKDASSNERSPFQRLGFMLSVKVKYFLLLCDLKANFYLC